MPQIVNAYMRGEGGMAADTMEAAVFRGDGRLSIETVPVPRIRRDDDVLLRVLACGVCGTDLHILSVPPGHPATPGVVLGHEYTGEVVEVGPAVTHLRPGDRVVVDANLKCGHCLACRCGRAHMCANMTTLGIYLDGGFAPYNVAPAAALHPIDPSVPPHLAAFAEILSCVVNGARKVRMGPGDTVVILGAGPAGLLFTQMARAAGARVVVAEVSPYRQRCRRDFSGGHPAHRSRRAAAGKAHHPPGFRQGTARGLGRPPAPGGYQGHRRAVAASWRLWFKRPWIKGGMRRQRHGRLFEQAQEEPAKDAGGGSGSRWNNGISMQRRLEA